MKTHPAAKMTMVDVMRKVAEMAESLYPGFLHAEIVVRVRPDLPNVVLPVTRLTLYVPADEK